MTRGEFMIQMLEAVFETKYIEFYEIKNSVVKYNKGGSFVKDCSYTSNYKKKMRELFSRLLDSNCEMVLINKNNFSQPQPIEPYYEKAKNFIFDLFKDEERLSEEAIAAIKESITIKRISRIYQGIIIEKLFDVGDKKESKQRKDDSFDESIQQICELVVEFIHSELPEMLSRKHKNDFFRRLVEQYPIFSELDLDEENKIVEKHLKQEEQTICITFGTAEVDLLQMIEWKEECERDNSEFVRFGDIDIMNEAAFLDLGFKLEALCSNAQSYPNVYKRDDVIKFKNAAVRMYNRLYGRNHPEYEDVAYLAAWNNHVLFIDYLFTLHFVLQYYGEIE